MQQKIISGLLFFILGLCFIAFCVKAYDASIQNKITETENKIADITDAQSKTHELANYYRTNFDDEFSKNIICNLQENWLHLNDKKISLQNELDKLKSDKINYDNVKKNSMGVISGNSNFKAYMDYRTITNKSSEQWKLQQRAITGDYGIRTVDGYYCIAVGTGYSNTVGEKLKVNLQNNESIMCIVGDIKSDIHTDATHTYCLSNGSVIEFIVDVKTLNPSAKKLGTLSVIDKFKGNVISIEKVR